MALSYDIDPAARLVTITGEYAGPDEWTRLLGQVLTDERLRPGFAFLRDLRGATTPVDAATVVGILDAVRRFWPRLRPSRAAIVTTRAFDPAALAAHALADSHGLPIRMFTQFEAALDWLQEGAQQERDGPAGA